MSTQACCNFLRGSMYVSKYIDPCLDLGCNDGLVYQDLGNISQATMTINSSVLGIDSNLNSFYKDEARKSINGINLNITLQCSKDSNFIKFLGLEKEELNSGTETLRISCKPKKCDVFFLKRNPTNIIITLKDSDGVSVRDLILDQEYIVKNDKIELLEDIADVYSYLEVSYDYNEDVFYDLKGLQNFDSKYNVLFKGTTYLEGENQSFDVEMYKVNFSFLSSLDLISDGSFLNLSLQGIVEKDLSRDCKGLDAYFKIKKEIGVC